MNVRNFLIVSLLASTNLFSQLGFAQNNSIEIIDRILVVVNDGVITYDEFVEKFKLVMREPSSKSVPPPILRRRTLEDMIDELVQVQRAKKDGANVPERFVDRAMDSVAKQNKLTISELQQEMEQDGVDLDAFRENIAKQLLIRQLINKYVGRRIVVSQDEVDHYLATQSIEGGAVAEFNVSHILISVSESATPADLEAAKQRAQAVYTKIRSGAEFAAVAAEYSNAPDGKKGGSLGWRKEGKLPKLFINTVSKLTIGDVSEVFRSPNGFHILKLDDRRGSKQNMVLQHKTRHILIKVSEAVTVEDAKTQLANIKKRILEGYDFAALSDAHSEDKVAKTSGGDLGWVDLGVMHPDFEKVMVALEIGEISDPIVTKFGAHLVQVTDRREIDAAPRKEREKARQEIFKQKLKESAEQFIQRLRADAHVEYRFEAL